jgi:adenosylcobinamide amidohydrolase
MDHLGKLEKSGHSVGTPLRKLKVSNEPWRWSMRGRTLAVFLPARWLVLGWAPLGGGFKRADLIVNHQIELDDRAATQAPRAHLTGVVRALRHDSGRAVAMMTGAQIARAGCATLARDGLIVGAWCSAGCTNALRVGDRATVGVPRAAEPEGRKMPAVKPGTINIIVAINQPLTRAAMAEALQIAVEARVAAVHDAGVVSMRSGAIATGTGTDCIAVAAPASSSRANSIAYCGKHTLPGELIGRAVMRTCAAAIARAVN